MSLAMTRIALDSTPSSRLTFSGRKYRPKVESSSLAKTPLPLPPLLQLRLRRSRSRSLRALAPPRDGCLPLGPRRRAPSGLDVRSVRKLPAFALGLRLCHHRRLLRNTILAFNDVRSCGGRRGQRACRIGGLGNRSRDFERRRRRRCGGGRLLLVSGGSLGVERDVRRNIVPLIARVGVSAWRDGADEVDMRLGAHRSRLKGGCESGRVCLSRRVDRVDELVTLSNLCSRTRQLC